MTSVFAFDQGATLRCSTLTLPNTPVGRVLVTSAGNTVTHSDITMTQLGYARGLTGPVQAALDTSLPTGLAASRVLTSNSAGVLDVSDVSVNELEFVRGLSGSIQTQLASAGTQVVSMPYTWSTNGLILQNSPLQFTPEPLRTYVVDAHLIVYANATDHTSSYGVRWPSLQNSNAGMVTMSYQANASTATQTRSSASTTDPLCVVQTATLANVPWMLSMRAIFATGPTVSNPFAIVANTNNRRRWAHLLYGSHIAYQPFVNAPNVAPLQITGAASSYTLASNGTPTILTLARQGSEGVTLTWSYAIVQGTLGSTATISQADNVFTITPSPLEINAGTFIVRFATTDGTTTTYKNVQFTLPSTPPSVTNINSAYTLSTTEVDTVITVFATDPEGTGLTFAYEIVSGSPDQIATVLRNGVAADPNVFATDNVFTIRPSAGETYAGSFTLKFGASDGTNVTYTNLATFTKPSTAPTITSPSLNASYTLATNGTPTIIMVTATDPEGTPLTYDYEEINGTTLGATATVSESNGVFTITPSTNPANSGTFQLRFSVTDGVNTVYTNGATFTLAFPPPQWQTASGSLGSDYTQRTSTFTVSATSFSSVTYSVVSGSLPTGLNLNTSTGVISGTASGVADYSSTNYAFTLRATNSAGSSDRAFSITIASRYVGYTCATANEGSQLTITAPAGMVFNRRDFSAYGTPNGSCGSFSIGGCNSISSNSWSGPIGQNSASTMADNNTWGDPCVGTSKRMYVQFTYGPF